MRKKLLFVLLFALLCVMLSAKSYHATNYYCMITVQDNGDLKVTETFTYKFQGGPFTWVKRDVPDKYTDGLELIGAAYIIDGVREEIEPDWNGRGDIDLKWEFGPVSDREVDFELRYVALNACFVENDQQIVRWRPLPADHDFRIDRIQVDMYLPTGVNDINILPSGRKSVKAGKAGNHVWWEAIDFKKDQSFVSKVSLPEGTLHLQQPQWQINREQVAAHSMLFVILGIISGLLIIALFVVLIINENNLKKEYTPDVIPNNLMDMHPGLVAKIIHGLEGSPVPAAAMLFRLIKQGYVKINKTGKKKYEYELIDNVPEDELDLLLYNELQKKIAAGKKDVKKIFSGIEKFKKVFNKQAVKKLEEFGFISIEGRKQQNSYTIYIISALLLFIASLITGLIMLEKGLIAFTVISFLLFDLLLYLIIRVSKIYSYSPEGFHLKYAWKQWVKELKRELREKRLSPEKKDFDQMFPYVMILGMSEQYMKYFKKAGIDISESVLIKSFDSYEDFHGFIVWYVAVANASGASGAGAAGGASGGGGGASAG